MAMPSYNWRDIKDRRLEQAVKPENVERLEKYLGTPKDLHLISETSGFKVTQTSRGDCYEWFFLESITPCRANFSACLCHKQWKPTHILFGENWLHNP